MTGLVDNDYAVPPPGSGIANVRHRLFLGQKRDEKIVQSTIDLLKSKKEDLIQIIEGFEVLTKRNRKEIIKYVESFYKVLENEKKVAELFVEKE